jgi:hypothetical protein
MDLPNGSTSMSQQESGTREARLEVHGRGAIAFGATTQAKQTLELVIVARGDRTTCTTTSRNEMNFAWAYVIEDHFHGGPVPTLRGSRSERLRWANGVWTSESPGRPFELPGMAPLVLTVSRDLNASGPDPTVTVTTSWDLTFGG